MGCLAHRDLMFGSVLFSNRDLGKFQNEINIILAPIFCGAVWRRQKLKINRIYHN